MLTNVERAVSNIEGLNETIIYSIQRRHLIYFKFVTIINIELQTEKTTKITILPFFNLYDLRLNFLFCIKIAIFSNKLWFKEIQNYNLDVRQNCNFKLKW